MEGQAPAKPQTTKSHWWSWSISSEELDRQVNQYHDLKIFESYRGNCVLFFLFVMGWTLLLVIGMTVFGITFPMSISEVIVGLLPYAALLIFVYKGHRWAMIVLLLYWVVDKISTIVLVSGYTSNNAVSFLFLYMGVVYTVKAIVVENARIARKSQAVA